MIDSNTDEHPGFFRSIGRDDGLQRALAGVVVATVVALTKRLIFKA